MNQKLIQKYNVQGPRYTSYPTVPYWDASPSEKEWTNYLKEEAIRSEQAGYGAALYVHIPFCRSLCTYCGCNTRITRQTSVGLPYVSTLLKEWDLLQKKAGHRFRVQELHLGGGTPTFLTPEELKILVNGLVSYSEAVAPAEFSIEVDPRVTTREHLVMLRDLGFRRISMGIQDFDAKVQEIVHRIQSVEQVAKLTEQCRELGFTSINFDLIYGLPLQSQESIRLTMKEVVALRPDRIAFYSYAHVPWIKASQRRFTEADLPNGDEKRKIYELGRELLEAASYQEIGMDHFALASDSLAQASRSRSVHRNFMGYTSQHVSPLIGLGVSAISDSWTCFAQNEKLLEKYVQAIDSGRLALHRGHVLTEEDLQLRKLNLDLMCALEGNLSKVDAEILSELAAEPVLREFESDGLIQRNDGNINVTELGRPFLRNICMVFDARLKRKAPETQVFSRTI